MVVQFHSISTPYLDNASLALPIVTFDIPSSSPNCGLMLSMKHPILAESSPLLLSTTDISSRIAQLKQIKHHLTGHVSRKVAALNDGLIPLLADSLHHVNGSNAAAQLYDEVYTHTAQIVAVLAHEGPRFVRPLLDTDLAQLLISFIHSTQLHSAKSTLAVLRSLVAVAEHLPTQLAHLLYSNARIECFTRVLDLADSNPLSQQSCDAALTLLCKTLISEQYKRAAVESGLLTSLSTRLASFVVAEGLIPPRSSKSLDPEPSPLPSLPHPAHPLAHLSPVLESISLLIERSKARATLFLASPSIKCVLPDAKDDFSPSDLRNGPWGTSYFSGGAVPRLRTSGPFDALLPHVPVSDKTNQAGFPPLSSVQPMPKRRASFIPSTTLDNAQLPQGVPLSDDQEETSLVSWLLYVIRDSRGKRRLLAIKLLVNLYSLNLVSRYRASTFASLVVPLLTRMLDTDQSRLDDALHSNGSFLCSGMHYTKAVPAVLAMLIMDDPEMQRVAVEGKAIVNLATGLKQTFDNPTAQKMRPWQPRKATGLQTTHFTTAPSDLHPGTVSSSTLRQEMQFREGCLQALAAIAPFHDEYRKEICAQGALVHIMSALEPYQVQPGLDDYTELTGNSTPVILAACSAVRVLTRSVKALRTKLVEAEVAKPILKLMGSSDPEIRIAATMVLANLAIDFSPMKDGISESTVVKKLCEQAHSANARLRLESLWALKQLVLNASKKLKQEVVDELGSSWIKLLIKTDPIDIPEGEVIGLIEREYPPLNVYRTPVAREPTSSPDIAMSEDLEMDSDKGPKIDSSTHQDSSAHFDARRTTYDDIEIQAQLLDLLRNLFCGDNASDLVKYVLDEMGHDDFFKILLDRLKSRTLTGPTRKDNCTTPAPSIVVVKVLYIIVHIAACEPRWRNAIATNHALMKQILTFANHADREIRAQCCWIAINLTYEDDASDGLACRQRALELQKTGFVPLLRKLENDPDLNVRERAKTAIHLVAKLIAS